MPARPVTPFAADIRAAVAFLRRVRSADPALDRRLKSNAALLDRAAAHLETLETNMRDLNTLIPIVVADVTSLRAANAAKDATIADLTAQLAAAQAGAATPENLAALDALEPESVAK